MLFSLDPQPAADEIECAQCGALVYIELTRCPECGASLYPIDDDLDDEYRIVAYRQRARIISKIRDLYHRLIGQPYSIEEVFGDASVQADLYADLLLKVGGDEKVVERLIDYERQLQPNGNRMLWLHNAIDHWERDNRISHFNVNL